jgi:hypothetical protein
MRISISPNKMDKQTGYHALKGLLSIPKFGSKSLGAWLTLVLNCYEWLEIGAETLIRQVYSG